MALFKLDHADFCPTTHEREKAAKPDRKPILLSDFTPEEWEAVRLTLDEFRRSGQLTPGSSPEALYCQAVSRTLGKSR